MLDGLRGMPRFVIYGAAEDPGIDDIAPDIVEAHFSARDENGSQRSSGANRVKKYLDDEPKLQAYAVTASSEPLLLRIF